MHQPIKFNYIIFKKICQNPLVLTLLDQWRMPRVLFAKNLRAKCISTVRISSIRKSFRSRYLTLSQKTRAVGNYKSGSLYNFHSANRQLSNLSSPSLSLGTEIDISVRFVSDDANNFGVGTEFGAGKKGNIFYPLHHTSRANKA